MPAADGSVGVAAIGYAFMGKAHSGAWRNVNAYFDGPRVRQQVLVGRNQYAVAAAASKFGWEESATDWRAVLERDDIDVVDIMTPGHLHAEIAIAALEAGKHVVVEKPLANSLEHAELMAAAAQEAAARGRHAIVNFNYRRVPAIALAKRLIDGGRIGAIRHVRASYMQDWLADPATPMSWRLRREEAGSGALGDLGSHLTDLVLHLTGESIVELTGGTRTFVGERPTGESGDGAIGRKDGRGPMEAVTVDDAAWASAKLSGGGIAQLEATRMARGRKNALRIELYGSLGSLTFDLERLNELELFEATAADGTQGFTRILVTEAGHPWIGAWWPDGHIIGWEHTFTHQFAQLLTDLRDGVASTPSFADGLAVQRVLDAIERSASAGGASVSV
jgi:predicted dehydrogenase